MALRASSEGQLAEDQVGLGTCPSRGSSREWLTNASIAALAVTLRTVCEPGDEVVIVSPPHFLYEPLIRAAGANAVRVKVLPKTFDLDEEAVARALTPRTRAMVVNTPHNPTGKILPPETLQRLAALLTEASERHQPIYARVFPGPAWLFPSIPDRY